MNGSSSGASSLRPGLARFEQFELELETGRLRKNGIRVKLRPQAGRVLALLLANAGIPVSREQIRAAIWPEGTFVDFEHGLNFCIRQIRSALNDSADNPRFVETIPRHGYRFVGTVEFVETAGFRPRPGPIPVPTAAQSATAEPVAAPAPPTNVPPPLGLRGRNPWVVAQWAAILVLLAIAVWFGRTRTHASDKGRVMLAVLPFQNLSGSDSEEYICDGMTEELISQLGQVDPDRLGVIARTSAMRYKKTGEDIAHIGKELGVSYVIEGSLRTEGRRARVTAQLIRVDDQSHLWAADYDGELSDMLNVEDRVSTAIAEVLSHKLVQKAHPQRVVAESVHDAYLRGMYFRNQNTASGFRKAIDLFRWAIQEDPSYAPAYAGLAGCYILLYDFDVLSPAESVPESRSAVEQALRLEPSLPEAHAVSGYIAFVHDRDFVRAEAEFQKAIALNPSYATAYHWYALLLASRGRFDDAMAEIGRAQQLDPKSLIIASNRGLILYFNHRFDEAIAEYRQVLETSPNFVPALIKSGWAYERTAQYAESRAAFERVAQVVGDDVGTLAARTRIAGDSGDKARLEQYRQRLDSAATREFVSATEYVQVYLGFGERQKAIQFMRRALAAHDPWSVYAAVDPNLDALRGDPQFVATLEAAGLLQPRR
jgi:TolB-like protein/DNA-binding winged helix-turn-helix (wHTH) protein/cytochrome c-type biogenesis protein CcmH/NrfG